ncbi:MAG: PDZ domain-containing protein [Fimbriimonadaceae bacterium]|nr:PDZ domain-containing protein [Chitinophagales bacterium]
MKAFKLLSILFIAAIPFLSVAQNNDEQVHIKIDALINGEQINIDTTIDDLGDFDLEEYLEQLGIEDDMSELNIDITDDAAFNFDFNFDEMALEEMLQNLENIEMPELPEMPDMPALAPLENFSFSNGNKAFLGVMTETMEKNEGVKITEVIENTAAAEAGLKTDDIITKIDEKTIESTNNLIEILSVYNPGDKVKVTYTRNGKIETSTATLKENEEYKNWEEYEKNWEEWGKEYEQNWQNWEKENGDKWNQNIDTNMYKIEERGFLGVIIDDMDNDAGVKISDIVEESAAEEIGLKAGDIINSIDGKEMKNYDDVLEAIQNKKPGDVINVNYSRDGKTNDVKATLKGNQKMIWKNKGDEEGMIWDAPTPGKGIKVYSCPGPINAYCYTLDGEKKSINMSIKVISNTAAAPSPDNSSKSTGSLLDPETIQFYPNPTTGVFSLKFNLNQNGDTEIIIRDIDGKVVYTESLAGFEGSYEKTIDLGQSAKGTYFINIKQNDYTATKQIVLQ